MYIIWNSIWTLLHTHKRAVITKKNWHFRQNFIWYTCLWLLIPIATIQFNTNIFLLKSVRSEWFWLTKNLAASKLTDRQRRVKIVYKSRLQNYFIMIKIRYVLCYGQSFIIPMKFCKIHFLKNCVNWKWRRSTVPALFFTDFCY